MKNKTVNFLTCAIIPAHAVTNLLLCINQNCCTTIAYNLPMKTVLHNMQVLNCSSSSTYRIIDKYWLFDSKKSAAICFNKIEQRAPNNLAAKQKMRYE